MSFGQESKNAHAGDHHQYQDGNEQINPNGPRSNTPVLFEPECSSNLAQPQYDAHNNDRNHSGREDSRKTQNAVVFGYNR